VKYKTIIFKALKSEVVDAVVTQVRDIGFFQMKIFVSRHNMNE
jgi:DNA-directed RNA polymerase subunit E'/Rpb7